VTRAKPHVVPLDPRAGQVYGVFGALPVGAIVILPGGVVLKVEFDGTVNEVGGVPMRRSIASDPMARRP